MTLVCYQLSRTLPWHSGQHIFDCATLRQHRICELEKEEKSGKQTLCQGMHLVSQVDMWQPWINQSAFHIHRCWTQEEHSRQGYQWYDIIYLHHSPSPRFHVNFSHHQCHPQGSGCSHTGNHQPKPPWDRQNGTKTDGLRKPPC